MEQMQNNTVKRRFMNEPTVTFSSNRMTFNTRATELLNGYTFMEFYIDEKEKEIFMVWHVSDMIYRHTITLKVSGKQSSVCYTSLCKFVLDNWADDQKRFLLEVVENHKGIKGKGFLLKFK